MKKTLGMLLVGVLVAAGGIAVASHVDTPPISDGGELAYVRDFNATALDTAQDGETVSATYVAWALGNDTIDGYTSRGRMADTQVYDRIDLADGSLNATPEFRAVEQWERGMVVVDSDRSCIGLLNGVNAGMVYIGQQDSDLRFKTTGHYSVTQVDDHRVELGRDGHTFALETVGENASLEVTGVNIWVNLTAGDQVRSWIDGGAFPATTEVMHSEFDHLADGCPAVVEEEPEECAPADETGPGEECPSEEEPEEHECAPADESGPGDECPKEEEPEEEKCEHDHEHEEDECTC